MERDAGEESAGSGGRSGAGGSAGEGVPTGTWTNVTGSLAGVSSECGNVSYLSTHPKKDLLMAGVATRGLYSSTDGAKSWSVMNTGSGAEPITNRPSQIVYDPNSPDTFYVAGIYHAPGVFKTTDNGVTFHALGDITHNDSVSVDFTDPQRRTLLAGGHEQVQTVHRSTDGGQTWTNVGANLPADSNQSSFVLAIDAQIHLVGCSGWAQGKSGIFRTTNGGQSWSQVSSLGGGFTPLVHSDGSIYWVTRDGASMVRSTDKGATWEMVTASGVVYGIQPIELPDGRIATRGGQGVIASSDHGKTWSQVAPPTPFEFGIAPLVYSSFQKAFYSSYWTCMPTEVPANAIAKYAYDAGP
jgi:photosystem II stability/assembly factor-like uncharacterized protein